MSRFDTSLMNVSSSCLTITLFVTRGALRDSRPLPTQIAEMSRYFFISFTSVSHRAWILSKSGGPNGFSAVPGKMM